MSEREPDDQLPDESSAPDDGSVPGGAAEPDGGDEGPGRHRVFEVGASPSPPRTPEQLNAAMAAAVAGLVKSTGISQRLAKDLNVEAIGKQVIPDGLFSEAKLLGESVPIRLGRPDPVVSRLSEMVSDMPSPPTGGQLEELNEAARQQGTHLKAILDVLVESVALSREATAAARQAAEQSRESQEIARDSSRAAWIGLYLLVGFSALQLIIAVIELGK